MSYIAYEFHEQCESEVDELLVENDALRDRNDKLLTRLEQALADLGNESEVKLKYIRETIELRHDNQQLRNKLNMIAAAHDGVTTDNA